MTIPAAACVTKTLDYDNRDEVKFVLMGSQAVSDVKVGSLGCGYVYSLIPTQLHTVLNGCEVTCLYIEKRNSLYYTSHPNLQLNLSSQL